MIEPFIKNLSPTAKLLIGTVVIAGIFLGALNSYHQYKLAKIRIDKEKL
jgi:hypothetical protein